jgi:hypothetical protein
MESGLPKSWTVWSGRWGPGRTWPRPAPGFSLAPHLGPVAVEMDSKCDAGCLDQTCFSARNPHPSAGCGFRQTPGCFLGLQRPRLLQRGEQLVHHHASAARARQPGDVGSLGSGSRSVEVSPWQQRRGESPRTPAGAVDLPGSLLRLP